MSKTYYQKGKQKWNKTLYKPEDIALFSHLEHIKIGKNHFDNDDLAKYFNINDITLLKQVFQEEYPITRNSDNLPRVPTQPDQKVRLIECMTKYFNHLRFKIIEKKHKSGDSVSLRELIDELQSIKTLKEHFEESKETFPYHMFKDYLNNKDFINLKGDIQIQMRALEQNKAQDERIRNLLRQFAMTYIKNKNKNKFTLRDPGLGEKELNTFLEDQGELPIPLLKMIETLKGQIIFDGRDNSEDYKAIREFVNEMRDTLSGAKIEIGADPIIGGNLKEELDDVKQEYQGVLSVAIKRYNDLVVKYKQKKDDVYKLSAKDFDSTLENLECKSKLEEASKKAAEEKVKAGNALAEVENKKDEIQNLKKQLRIEKEKPNITEGEKAEAKITIKNLKRQIAAKDKEREDAVKSAEAATASAVTALKEEEATARASAAAAAAAAAASQAGSAAAVQAAQQAAAAEIARITAEKDALIAASQGEAAEAKRLTEAAVAQAELEKAAANEVFSARITAAIAEAELEASTKASQDINTLRAELERQLRDQTEAARANEEIIRQEAATQRDRNVGALEERRVGELATAQATRDRELAAAEETRVRELAVAEETRVREAEEGEREREELQEQIRILTAAASGSEQQKQAAIQSALEQQRQTLQAARDNEARIREEAKRQRNTNVAAVEERRVGELEAAEARRLREAEEASAERQREREAARKASQDINTLRAELERQLRDQTEAARVREARIREEAATQRNRNVGAVEARRVGELATAEATRDREAQEVAEERQRERELLQAQIGNLREAASRSEEEKQAAIQSALEQQRETVEAAFAANKAAIESQERIAQQAIAAAAAEQERLQGELVALATKPNTELRAAEAQHKARETSLKAQLAQAEAAKKAAEAIVNSTISAKDAVEAQMAKEKQKCNVEKARLTGEALAIAQRARDAASEAARKLSVLQAEKEALQRERTATSGERQSERQRLEERIDAAKAEAQRARADATEKDRQLTLAKDAEAAAKRESAGKTTQIATLSAEKEQAAQTAEAARAVTVEREARFNAQLAAINEANATAAAAKEEANAAALVAEQAKTTRVSQERNDVRGKLAITTSQRNLARRQRNDARDELTTATRDKTSAVVAKAHAEVAAYVAAQAQEAAETLSQEIEAQAARDVEAAQAEVRVAQTQVAEAKGLIELEKEARERAEAAVLELNNRLVEQKILYERRPTYNEVVRGIHKVPITFPIKRGGGQDTLLDYCNKVANDSLNTFLSEDPLPFFSLIEDFEKASKMDVLRPTNEEYILKLFIQRHLEEHFETKEMKEFYFHAKELFGKQDCSEYAKMFFVLNEIINVIRDSKEDIDIVRIKSKEYNSSFDYLEYILQGSEYDFYNVAKKKFILDEDDTKQMDLTFKDTIFICINKGKKTYDFNKNLTLKRADFDYKEDICYINSQMVYLFFILSTHFYLQSENMIDNDEYIALENNLEKTVRKLKRSKNKEKRSIEKLFKERKEFKLDG